MNWGDQRLPARFWDKAVPEPNTGCWLWTGAYTGNYGAIQWKQDGKWRLRNSHRIAYLALIGEIPAGLHIDHRCYTQACCNPAHMEPVTQRENAFRIRRPVACPAGHVYAEGSYWERKLRRSSIKRERICKECTK